MDPWMWWLVAAGLFALVETQATSLHFIMLAGGAASAAVVAGVGGGVALQLATFAAVSGLLLVVVRPIATRHLQQPAEIRTGVDALVGADAVVVERVDGNDGRVKLGGEIWSARSYDTQSVLEPGQHVQVIEISGATALVL